MKKVSCTKKLLIFCKKKLKLHEMKSVKLIDATFNPVVIVSVLQKKSKALLRCAFNHNRRIF